MMKGWIVSTKFGEYVLPLHAETRGQAKSRAIDWDLGEEFLTHSCFPDISARRLPGIDGKRITYESLKAAGFEYTDESGEADQLAEAYFVNYCNCEICRK